ncbi:MAG: hypothetical protein CVU73_09980 [Deltaproteobacteria bacterium HGW-Deltaproteobacteria-8]|jgi:hypothetical protein|nr:MAG: hypothetical protein CVU73_09980 [Deltaproteobacteria bacterium HGW-Deltaproteobacteria-8]
MRILSAMALVLLLSSFALAGVTSPLVDIPLIAGKNEASVAKILGKPKGSEKTKFGPKKIYKLSLGGKVEVVYIQGKADWITVTPGVGTLVSFGPEAIRMVGLPSATPSFHNKATIRWSNVNGLLEISIFPAGKNVFYWYIKARTQ